LVDLGLRKHNISIFRC